MKISESRIILKSILQVTHIYLKYNIQNFFNSCLLNMYQKFHPFVSKSWLLEIYSKEITSKDIPQQNIFIYESKKKKKRKNLKEKKLKSKDSIKGSIINCTVMIK